MQTGYRHTQTGWVVIFSLVAAAVLLIAVLGPADMPLLLAITLTIDGLALLLFATLTVTVDGEAICAGLGIGLIRKRGVRLPDDQLRGSGPDQALVQTADG